MGSLAGLLVPPPPPPWPVDPEAANEPFITAWEQWGPAVDHYPGPRRPLPCLAEPDGEPLEEFEDAPPGRGITQVPPPAPWPVQEPLAEELEPAPPGQRRQFVPSPRRPPETVFLEEYG